jgi:hypothetical protein
MNNRFALAISTVLMASAGLMHKYSMTTEESIDNRRINRERRPQVMPNEGFMRNLRITRPAHP